LSIIFSIISLSDKSLFCKSKSDTPAVNISLKSEGVVLVPSSQSQPKPTIKNIQTKKIYATIN